jgi:D-lactate dehydrogenase
VAGTCCATPWQSKGFREGFEHMSGRTVGALRRWSGDGALPVVIDATSCTQGLLEAGAEGLEVLDAVQWAARLLPSLTVRRRVPRAVVHPTCASKQLLLHEELAEVVGALAEEVDVPAASSCCGMAGDRGLLHPELPPAALREESAEVGARPADEYLSSNRTCEIALREATGRPYRSFALLLDELTREPPSRAPRAAGSARRRR